MNPFPAETYLVRLERVYARLGERGMHALFLPPSGDLEYLTGFRRRPASNTDLVQPADWLYGALIIPWQGVYLVSPYMVSRFVRAEVQGKPWIAGVLYLPEFDDPQRFLAETAASFGLGGLGGMTLALGNRARWETACYLRNTFPGLNLVPAGDVVSGLRMVKDTAELELMRRAAAIADQAFAAILPRLKPGVTEREVVSEVEDQLRRAGAERTSFPTTVTFTGQDQAHGRADPPADGPADAPAGSGGRRLGPGMHVAFDFGAVYQGYCSDFGRTVFCGDVAPELVRIHGLIMEAQAAGMAAMKAGQVTGAMADKAARDVLAAAGYGECFGHRLGHGIGCDVHEAPFLTRSEERVLQAGMTFTVEPSCRRDAEVAVRVEDVVLVTPEGGQSLMSTTKDLIVV